MVDFMYQDKPYMFCGYARPMTGSVFVGSKGGVVKRTSKGVSVHTRMILKPKEVLHTFDGVVFKEGEMEPSKVGRWYLFCGRADMGMSQGNLQRRLYPIFLT